MLLTALCTLLFPTFIERIETAVVLPRPLVQEADTFESEADAYRDLFRHSKGDEDKMIESIDKFLQRYLADGERLRVIAEELELGVEPKETRVFKKEIKALDKERDDLIDEVWYCFKKRTDEKHEANHRVWKAAAYAFAQMGSEGADYLLKAFADKRFSRLPELLGLFIEQVGYTHDYSKTDDLVGLLDHHQYIVIAKSAFALSQFGDAPGKLRKEAVGVLVRTLESYRNAASDNLETAEVRRYRQTREPMLRALTALTGESFRESLAWTNWWNTNRKKAKYWKDKE